MCHCCLLKGMQADRPLASGCLIEPPPWCLLDLLQNLYLQVSAAEYRAAQLQCWHCVASTHNNEGDFGACYRPVGVMGVKVYAVV